MKTLKQFLTEKGAGGVGTEHYDVYELIFSYEDIGAGMPYVPFYGKRQERIQGKLEKTLAYHVTDFYGIDGLSELKGGSRSGSFFTQSTGGILQGAVTSGGVLVQVMARPILKTMQDIYSEVDKQGRRWVSSAFFTDDNGDGIPDDNDSMMYIDEHVMWIGGNGDTIWE